ncbi:MAG: right-handed parallel beta-helix repeat-containing protein [Planctomycetes bacterium]|nr:right-handed parallel beta-helix repeat-containing protein [Planctomycetota bacterium]
MDRRNFLGTTAGTLTATGLAAGSDTEGRPPLASPRATSGDAVAQLKWEERLTLRVGPRKADLVGSTDRVLQAAVDYVARLGGGTVHILPGTYLLRNSVFLRSGVRLLGSGAEVVLLKAPSVSTRLSADSDWYDQEITLADAAGFELGDGVCLRAKNPDHGGSEVLKRTLVARSGKRFRLDRPLRHNFWLIGEATAATLFPLLCGDEIADVVIENLVLDGNRKKNDHLDGNYGGCIWLQDCNRVTVRGVTARNNNGDGISWQVCHDVLVEKCHCHDNADLGLHPGSGSQRPIIRGNRLERNTIGLFFCWGVKNGLAEKNVIEDSKNYGISIGHRDTNNLVRDNDVRKSGKVGVLFRRERGKAFAPHRNRLEGNRITDSGPEDGVAIDVQGETEEVTICRNDVRETRGRGKRIGVRLGKQTRDIRLVDNQFEGLAVEVERGQ